MSSVSLMPGSGNGRRAESAGSESDPGTERYQCGTYQMHSLQEAQDIARKFWNVTCASTATKNWRCRKRIAGTAHLVSLSRRGRAGENTPGFCYLSVIRYSTLCASSGWELPALRPSASRPLQELHTRAGILLVPLRPWHFQINDFYSAP